MAGNRRLINEYGSVWDDLQLGATDEADITRALHRLRADGFEMIGLPWDWSIRDWSLEVLSVVEEISAAAALRQRPLFL